MAIIFKRYWVLFVAGVGLLASITFDRLVIFFSIMFVGLCIFAAVDFIRERDRSSSTDRKI